jgi:hypothetical protein
MSRIKLRHRSFVQHGPFQCEGLAGRQTAFLPHLLFFLFALIAGEESGEGHELILAACQPLSVGVVPFSKSAEREWLDTKQELPKRKETDCTIEEFAALAAREPAYDDSARSNRSTNDGQTLQAADR